MFRLISDIIGYIALLALAGFFAHTIYTVTRGLFRRESFRSKLNYLVWHAMLFIGWLIILIAYFFPNQQYLKCFAFFAGVFNVSIFLGMLFILPIIAVGKITKVYFKNGEMKTYFPPRYSSDDDNYYFQRRKGGKEAVKKDSVEKIDQVKIRNVIPDIMKINRVPGIKKFYILNMLLLRYDYAIMAIIFTFVFLSFLI